MKRRIISTTTGWILLAASCVACAESASDVIDRMIDAEKANVAGIDNMFQKTRVAGYVIPEYFERDGDYLRPVTLGGPDGGRRDHRWSAKSGDCFRIFAVAEPGVRDLDVEVHGPRGSRLAFDTTDDRWPVVKPDGPLCVFDDGEYRARVSAPTGTGEYAIQIWRLR